MAKVWVHAVASLDGFIAHEDDGVDPLFDWYFNGEVPLQAGESHPAFAVSRASFDYTDPIWRSAGAQVIGRVLFDTTNGWNGVPVVGDRVFVVTHQPPSDWVPSQTLSADRAPFTFVDDVAEAIAQAKQVAGDRNVVVSAGDVGGQAIAAGLVDEVAIDLVPVVFGSGKRYFGGDPSIPLLLEDPHVVVQGDRVLHLRFRTRSANDAAT
jgi:dihydrofolate reductase